MSELDIIQAEQYVRNAINQANVAQGTSNASGQAEQKNQEAIVDAQINLVQVLFENGRISEQEAKSYIHQLAQQKDQNNVTNMQNGNASQVNTRSEQERSQVEEFVNLAQEINKMRSTSGYGAN